MLNSNEVINLEQRWKRWRQRQIFRRFFAFLSLTALFCLSFYIGFFLLVKGANSTKNSIVASVKEDTKELLKPDKPSDDKNSSVAQKDGPRLALTIQPVPRSSSSVSSTVPKSETIKLDRDEKVEKKLQKSKAIIPLAPKMVQEQKQEDSKIKTAKEKKESKIQINMKPTSANTTEYLKEKFDATGNIVFALMLSEEYYHQGQYNDAIRWALTANELDPKNERSWILFAQSKAKLGNTKEAINALEEFLKTNNSGKIESILIKLKRGAF
jgi:tetratricopeptide (TPR) repeat protein